MHTINVNLNPDILQTMEAKGSLDAELERMEDIQLHDPGKVPAVLREVQRAVVDLNKRLKDLDALHAPAHR